MKRKWNELLAGALGAIIVLTIVMAIPTQTKAQETAADQTETMGEFTRDAQEIVTDMGHGINLGNVMECCGTWINSTSVTNFETAWGAPVTTKKMIEGMKLAGFNSIRIPVSWSNMMDGSYSIDERYLKRVQELVDYALDADMYVIVNDHYDGGWWSELGKTATKAEAMKHYETMWKQVASYFKNYGEKLILESANEELTTNLGYAIVNEVNQTFVDLVRKSGGNNTKRYLLIAGVNTDIDNTVSDSFKMPQDTLQNHLMVSVHYYSTWNYCGMWKDESWGKADYDWGTQADRDYMKKQLAKMKKFSDKGVGVVVGEYSVLPNYISVGTYERKNNDVDYLTTFVSLCKEYGYAAYLWNTEDWYDKDNCVMRYADIAAIYNEIQASTSVFDGGIKVSWHKLKNAAGYQVYRDGKLVATCKKSASTYTDRAAHTNGRKYEYQVVAIDGSNTKLGQAVSPCYYIKPVSGTKAANSSKGVKLTWKADTKATGYVIKRSKDGAGFKTLATIKTAQANSWIDTTAKTGATYRYRFYAVLENGSLRSVSKYREVSLVAVKTPTLKTVTNPKSKKITATWSKQSGATGFEVRFITGTTTKTVKAKKAGATTASYTTAKKNATYKVSVRTYCVKNGRTYYSAWSSAKKVKATR